MPKLSKKHPALRGKMTVSLNLAKRPEGVSQLEATLEGGGTRLAAQIYHLTRLGHRFRKQWEDTNGCRFVRYWWLGFAEHGEDGDAA